MITTMWNDEGHLLGIAKDGQWLEVDERFDLNNDRPHFIINHFTTMMDDNTRKIECDYVENEPPLEMIWNSGKIASALWYSERIISERPEE